MAIKIDLEKAYDCLEWNFIRDTLKLFNFPNHLTSLIMSCVSTSSISVLVNGGGFDYFHPSRGIRQGDPLSPYLFILCMKVLGALITKKCEAKLWDPVKVALGGIAFSHLFFVDDLVLFAKTDRKNCIAIKNAIETYGVLSRQKVSDEKSRVFFSPNISREEELCSTLGYRSIPALGKYLGFPIKHTSDPHDFGFVIERVQSRLAGWKSHFLSFAGRLVLTQVVTATIPSYIMQCSILPPKIIKRVDKLSWDFLWGSTKKKKKIHMLSWKKVMKPKKDGGLGL